MAHDTPPRGRALPVSRREEKKARQLASRIVGYLNQPPVLVPINSLADLDLYDTLLEINPEASVFDHPGDLDADFDVEEAETQGVLQEYVSTWLAAGCRLGRWRLRGRLEKEINRRDFSLSDTGGRLHLSVLWPTPQETDPASHAGRVAGTKMFLDFLTGPFPDGIRQCPRCKRYFFTTDQRKRFCTPGCASHFHAVKATRKRQQAEREVKKKQVQDARERFEKASDPKKLLRRAGFKTWKHWVAREATARGSEVVSVKFVTTLVKRGELSIPAGLAG